MKAAGAAQGLRSRSQSPQGRAAARKRPGAAESQLRQFPVTDDDLLDAPDGDMAFAAAVAEFGMVLRDSEYRGDSSYETVVDLLTQAPLSDPYREEFFSLVKIAERADKLAK